jgi:hypothetical protein
MSTLRFWYLRWSITYLELALASLTNRQPCHADIPVIITEIQRLKDEAHKPAQPMTPDGIVTVASVTALIVLAILAATGVIL